MKTSKQRCVNVIRFNSSIPFDRPTETTRVSNLLQSFSVNYLSDQFKQFSRTVGQNAANQQKVIRDAYDTFCNFYSQSAYDANATWPFYTLPNFELHVSNVIKIQGTEIFYLMQYIKDEDADAALNYASMHHEEWIKQGHLTRYGNLDRLNPVNYNNYFTVLTAEGTLVPDTKKRPDHYAIWQTSPRTYSAHDTFVLVIYPSKANIFSYFKWISSTQYFNSNAGLFRH
jgi:hypothetical protein